MKKVPLIREGVCCDKSALLIYGGEFQIYVECIHCECRCAHPGEDDGQITCWTHHDCSKGECTHQDND